MGKVDKKGKQRRSPAPTTASSGTDPPAAVPSANDPLIAPVAPAASNNSPLPPAGASRDRTRTASASPAPASLQQQLQQRQHGVSNSSSNSKRRRRQRRRREPSITLDDILGRVSAAVSDAFPTPSPWAPEGQDPGSLKIAAQEITVMRTGTPTAPAPPATIRDPMGHVDAVPAQWPRTTGGCPQHPL